jgi:hypothetical protein
MYYPPSIQLGNHLGLIQSTNKRLLIEGLQHMKNLIFEKEIGPYFVNKHSNVDEAL